MARYLSQQWFDEMNASITAGDSKEPTHLVLQQVITGGPDGDVAYTMVIEDGSVRIEPGQHPGADVTITEDYQTAAAVHRGEVTLQDAFMTGRVKVSGNIASLIANQAALSSIQVAPSGTTYE